MRALADNSDENIWRKTDIKGIVTKILSFEHYVLCDDGKTYLCRLRGKQRRIGEVYVGDKVEFTTCGKIGNIENVLPRKNSLIRPYVANIDIAFIVVAIEPEPDLLLVDKLIVSCFNSDIKPIIVVNKCDIKSDTLSMIEKDYGEHFKILTVSAINSRGIDELAKFCEGKTVCFCGQSAVGKTTILNALTGLNAKTGGLSKIKRGRNTTRHIEAYEVCGGLVVDTCGFSLLDVDGIKAEELGLYYPEFDEGRASCKFSTCTHISEPECQIKKEVESGKISISRYNRYKELFEEIKNGRNKNERN